jgi:DNA-binding transcriptional MerR regulator
MNPSRGDRAKTAQQVSANFLADRVGEPYTTIDHWSDMDLLVFTRRGNRRLYDLELNVRLCREIRELQEAGMNLMTIRNQLSATIVGSETRNSKMR